MGGLVAGSLPCTLVLYLRGLAAMYEGFRTFDSMIVQQLLSGDTTDQQEVLGQCIVYISMCTCAAQMARMYALLKKRREQTESCSVRCCMRDAHESNIYLTYRSIYATAYVSHCLSALVVFKPRRLPATLNAVHI
jgi:GTP cyclohydrolase FolE2